MKPDTSDDPLYGINLWLRLRASQMKAMEKEAKGNGCSVQDLLRKRVMSYVEDITEAWDGNPYPCHGIIEEGDEQ